MRFGKCTNIDIGYEKVAAKCGLDYIETGLFDAVNLGEEKVKECLKSIESCGLKVESTNGFFPADIQFVGENADREKVKNYIDKATYFAAFMGVKTMVVGSGKSRSVPDNYPKEKALAELKNTICTICDYGEKYGIDVVIEPLSASETNFINKVSEGIALMDEYNKPNLKAFGDFYHMNNEGDITASLKALESAKDRLAHFHLAPVGDHHIPYLDDGTDYKPLFDTLKRMNYSGRVSIECWGSPKYETDEQQLTALMELLKFYGVK